MNGALTIGQKVVFGRENGEKTHGTIIGINAKSIKVRQDEARGGRPIGTEWRVAPSLVTPFEGAKVDAPAPQPPVVTRAPARATGWNIGDRASFTSKAGLIVTGTVTRVNTKTVTLEQCDDGSRGWRVPPSALRAPTAAAPAPRRDEDAVMRDIVNAYSDLSQENLTCDGELTRGQVSIRRAGIRLRLAALQRELGRQVTEAQAWNWYNLQGL